MFVPAYVLWHVGTNYCASGRFPSAFQRSRWLYRTGNYGVQQITNANPDNFFDRRHYCWTTDPKCGLEVGPKRPWEDLKEPAKKLDKLQIDSTRNQRLDKHGYQGF